MLTSLDTRSLLRQESCPQTESIAQRFTEGEIAACLYRSLQENQTPMSLQELETCLTTRQKLSYRILKETAWKLVEEGKIQFTSNWDLEIIDRRDY